MTSTCQFIANRVRGLSSRKRFAAKLTKSSRSSARGTPPGAVSAQSRRLARVAHATDKSAAGGRLEVGSG
jgi:hypothetical protein